MDDAEKTIQHLKKRDHDLRDAIEQLTFQNTRKRDHSARSLHAIRVKLTSLKWALQLLEDNTDLKNHKHAGELAAIKHQAAEALRMTEDLQRTLEDPA
ncbi:MAG: hypothetical protein AAB671_01870 [Patescibacteria group bacterium]